MQPFFRDAPAKFGHEVSRGGTSAETHDHAVLHELRCRFGGFFLKTVLLARVHDSSAATFETRRHDKRSAEGCQLAKDRELALIAAY
jgi:hypothetical protein